MSRALLRSALELRTPAARLPPSFLLPIRARSFNSTAPIIEPTSSASASSHDAASSTIQPPSAETQRANSTLSSRSSTSPQTLYPPSPPPATPPVLSDSVRQLLPLLASQPSHYITVHIHGRPYLVTPGDAIRLPFHMPGVVPGDVLRLDRASVIGSRDFTLKGSPYIDDRVFECRAVVTGSELEPVRITVKKKQRTRRARRVRSQHRFTTLTISELKIKGVEEIAGEGSSA
ncbi:hypothetical protein SODALDRAFT_363459 [Sodiomyces alkalinus F11]|uniref:Large ribosomal subunit protein bL21m n=1 Tax=Sodiomyces alkalinus (strain CBS 110278 / VKM F-3762 / F11) TaxID=1314773 RepID=A0A3N2PMF3_SODAK|nr:hypothetical protein SODALDRAFT_363459 [Sodiomyces alkalinus F11]ROT35600.1 hypothetical protein SODALDRAFT_363459 [Sodiomyces alkalinus F11]